MEGLADVQADATQFFEFVHAIADGGTDGGTVRMAPVSFQPMASDDFARVVSEVGAPVNDRVEAGGPERVPMGAFFPDALTAWHDPRKVIIDPHARSSGTELSERSLVPGNDAILGEIRYSD